MKTVKFILPVVAIMAAVAGVFATSNSDLTPPDFRDVTALSSSPCTLDGTCDVNVTTKLCKLASGQTFREISGGACSSTITVGAFVATQPSNP
jgi:hypothetical protein